MDENVVFKTATVGGFEKKAVLDYIFTMNENYDQETKSLLEEIESLKERQRTAEENSHMVNNKMRTMERDMAKVSGELIDEKKKRLELSEMSERLNSEIEKQKELLVAKGQEAQKYVEKSQLFADRNKDLESQKEDIEKASYQLGRVMLDARADADTIKSNAEEQARETVYQAGKEAEEIQASAEKEAQSIMDKVKSESENLVKSAKEKAKTELDSAKEKAETRISQADILSNATIAAAEAQAIEVLENAKSRVTEISDAAVHVSDESTVQLRDLRRETLAVRQAIQEIFLTLQEKSDSLDGTISVALETLEQTDILSSSQNLLEMPELNIDDLLAKANRATEVHVLEVETEIISETIEHQDVEHPKEVVAQETEKKEPPWVWALEEISEEAEEQQTIQGVQQEEAVETEESKEPEKSEETEKAELIVEEETVSSRDIELAEEPKKEATIEVETVENAKPTEMIGGFVDEERKLVGSESGLLDEEFHFTPLSLEDITVSKEDLEIAIGKKEELAEKKDIYLGISQGKESKDEKQGVKESGETKGGFL